MKKTQQLRNLLAGNETLIAPCAFDALSAKAIEHAGFKVAGTTGFGIHGAMLGVPDNGLIAFNEMVATCGRMADAINIPIIADAEGGYGNAINTMRTVREFEKAGVAGVFIEDQKSPPNCPFIKPVELVSMEEMVGKIKAAVAARTDPDFVIVARTDAPFEEAIERAQAYLEAGADMIKPIPKSRKELELWPKKISAPLHVGYMTGKSINDGMTCWDMGKLGYKIVTFPLNMLFMCTKSMITYLAEIREKGSDEALVTEMLSFDEYQRFIGLDKYIDLEKMYGPK